MQPFVIKLSGLKSGQSQFTWLADNSFFGQFENPDLLSAQIEAKVWVKNRGASIELVCELLGSVRVPCDRCLEELILPVETSFEETYTPEGDEVDISQDVYDYVMIALPMQRLHEEGECNVDTIKYLSK